MAAVPKNLVPLPKVFPVGFGASQMGTFTSSEANPLISRALELGINFFETSPAYSNSQTLLGAALKQAGVERENIVLCSGVSRHISWSKKAKRLSVYSVFDNIQQTVESSLKKLKTDYLDIVFLQEIEYAKNFEYEVMQLGLESLVNLKNQGLIRHIGVSGYPLKCLDFILNAKPKNEIDFVISTCQLNLRNDSLLSDGYVNEWKEKLGPGRIINCEPLEMGLLSHRDCFDPPLPSLHPATMLMRKTCENAASAIYKAYDVKLEDIALKYAFEISKSLPDLLCTTLLAFGSIEEIEHAVEMYKSPLNPDELRALEDATSLLKPAKNHTWVNGHERWQSTRNVRRLGIL